MVTPIIREKLGTFQEFEKWLDKQELLDSEVIYRGHAESTWKLESTLYRHQLALPHVRSADFGFPISEYTDVAKKLQAIVETHTDLRFDNTPGCDSFPTPPSRYPSDTQFISDTTGSRHHFWTGLHHPT